MADGGLPYDEAFARLEKAVEHDKAGRLGPAAEAYEAALATFQVIVEAEPDVQKRAVVERKIKGYQRRRLELTGDVKFEAASQLDRQHGPARAEAPYMEAVEAYLASLKLHEALPPGEDGGAQGRTPDQLRRRVAEILDRLEQIKGRQPPTPATTVVTPAAAAAAGPSTLNLSDLPLPPTTLPKLPVAPAPSPAAAPAPATQQHPRRRSSELTPAEIEVLKRSSTINGRVFLPWLDNEEGGEQFQFEFGPWTDPEGTLPLSQKQAAQLGGWRRPGQFVKPGQPCMIRAISPFSIEQDMVGDCSFISSLIICANYERKHRKPLVTRIIYPQDGEGRPRYNPSGKYLVKLWANGCARKVVVDDLFPVDRRGELLCACSKDRSELWVTVIEKAYMKLHGGYDFGGSNSGIDLYALTGWIPEQIFFEEGDASSSSTGRRQSGGGSGDGSRRRPPVLDHRQPTERAWERLRSASQFGDCLTTIATSQLDEREAEALGLVPLHAYAVLEVRECLGKRFLLVKNPWSRKSWRGPYSANDTARWTPELCRALGYDPRVAQTADDGVFWIDWHHVLKYFGSVYLNWNPGLFSYRTVTHALWPVGLGPKNDSFTYGQNPQYLLTVEPNGGGGGGGGGSVWVLLSRHVTQKEDQMQAGDFLTLHVYRGDKRVIYPSDDRVVQGVYSNNPHNLTRLDVDKADAGRVALVLSQYEKERDVYYTLTVFSTLPFKLRVAPPLPPVVARLDGGWDGASAGGRLGLRTFLHNPQFAIAVRTPGRVHLELLAPKEYFCSVSLIGGLRGGKRVDSILMGEEVLSSGAYRQGFAYAEAELQPGMYTAVCSTYEPGLKGNFVLNVRAEAPLQQATTLLPEGDGMIRQSLTGSWSLAAGNAGGSRPPGYLANPTYRFTCTERTRLLMRLVCAENEPINVSLYRADKGTGGIGLSPFAFPTAEDAVGSSHRGVYTACSCGVSTPAMELDAGVAYLAVVACYDEVDAAFELVLYSSSRGLTAQRVQ